MTKLAAIVSSFLVVCSATSLGLAGGGDEEQATERPIYVPPLISVIVDLQAFENKRVELFGFLGEGGSWLYITQDHAKHGDAVSAIMLQGNRSEILRSTCVNRYVRVTGTIVREHDWEPTVLTDLEQIFSSDLSRYCWQKMKTD